MKLIVEFIIGNFRAFLSFVSARLSSRASRWETRERLYRIKQQIRKPFSARFIERLVLWGELVYCVEILNNDTDSV